MEYYVYAYLRRDGTPYYIGKGKGRRITGPHTVSIPKDLTRIVMLETNLLEKDAIDIEIKLIKQYGRKDLGTGILHNRTDGGDGISGYAHTDVAKQKISKANSGRQSSMKGKKNPGLSKALKGKKQSPEHIAKLSAIRKGKPNPKLSEVKKGVPSPKKGRPQEKISCPYCNKVGGLPQMKQWHFDNCKEKYVKSAVQH